MPRMNTWTSPGPPPIAKTTMLISSRRILPMSVGRWDTCVTTHPKSLT
jgi:hypothetical protein